MQPISRIFTMNSRLRELATAILIVVVACAVGCFLFWVFGEEEDPIQSPFKVESVDGKGRWASASPELSSNELTEQQKIMIAQLEAIGYLQGVRKADNNKGAKIFDSKKTYKGKAVYVSGHGPEALMIDIQGKVLHKWRFPMKKAWPDYEVTTQGRDAQHYFRKAYVYENKDLLAIFEGYGIIKIDKDSKLIWARANGAHHDIDVLDNGDIYILTRKAHIIPKIDESNPKLEDFVVAMHSDGQPFLKVSLLEALLNSKYRDYVQQPDPRLPPRFSKYVKHGDMSHTNTVEFIRKDHPTVEWLKKGNVILSSAHLCALMVMDLQQKQIVWFHKGDFTVQHDPRLLENGNILFFDNHNHTKESRVIEIDPATTEIVWEYNGKPDNVFFSQCCSTAQRLPNGNTQIVITDMGRVIEVTPHKEIAWEFLSPHRAGEENELVASLFDMIRLPPDFPD